MTLRLKTVQNFMRKMNPCDLRPYYAEGCTECMDKFCFINNTTREEYRRKKAHLHTLQNRVGTLQDEIMAQIRKDPNSHVIAWKGEEFNQIEKEIDIT